MWGWGCSYRFTVTCMYVYHVRLTAHLLIVDFKERTFAQEFHQITTLHACTHCTQDRHTLYIYITVTI